MERMSFLCRWHSRSIIKFSINLTLKESKLCCELLFQMDLNIKDNCNSKNFLVYHTHICVMEYTGFFRPQIFNRPNFGWSGGSKMLAAWQRYQKTAQNT